MSEIIGNLTVGTVIAFCVVVGAIILWPEKHLNRKKKKDGKDDGSA